MKHLITTLFLTLFISGMAFGQTQLEINHEASEVYQKTDAELNQVYQQILKEYADDTTFLEALRTAQRNWIAFRDSELQMKYPDRAPGWYGSIQPTCVSYYLVELTNERTAKLKTWLTGLEEGDVCAGSVRLKK